MIVHINGEDREIPDALTVSGLLEWLEILPTLVAVEINRDVVQRHLHPETSVAAGDQIEIVTFTGGG